ncbi:MAG: hypothetical protein V3V00_02290, partial [Saprospiraceae bacterium]
MIITKTTFTSTKLSKRSPSLFAIFLALITCSLHAQPYNSTVTGPVAPSAAAMSFGKYADLPLDPASGTMAISIPLFGLSEGPLSHTISISNHLGAVRPSEIASNIGLGWNLNAGGVISRTVRGIPDDTNKNGNEQGYYWSGIDLFHPGQAPQARDSYDGKIDSETDIFFFNINGIASKFIIDASRKIIQIPKSDLLITCNTPGSDGFTNFTIVTPDGTKYFFGSTSTSTNSPYRQRVKVNGGDFYNETWFLRKIQSYDNKHDIDFNYTDNAYKYRSNPECTVTMWNDGSIQEDENCPTDPIKIEVDGRIISSITSATGTITFVNSLRFDLEIYQSSSGKRIKSIEFDDNYRCYKYDLTQDYFYHDGNNRATSTALKLEKIQRKSCDNTESEPPYLFDYIGQPFYDSQAGVFVQPFANRLTRAIDHWNYYNGKTANIALDNNIPNSNIAVGSNTFTYGSADRSVDLASTKIGALEKVTYPTGGHTIIDYENHDYEDAISGRQVVV